MMMMITRLLFNLVPGVVVGGEETEMVPWILWWWYFLFRVHCGEAGREDGSEETAGGPTDSALHHLFYRIAKQGDGHIVSVS